MCDLFSQDFIIYLLAAPHVVVGQQSAPEDKVKIDIPLFANDILSEHCFFQRLSVGGPIMLCPCQGAGVTRNGEFVKNAIQLSPSDVIGMGKHYLFLFRDPLSLTQEVEKDKSVRSLWLCFLTHTVNCDFFLQEPNSSDSEPCLSPAVPWILSHGLSAATNHTREPVLCNSCISNGTDRQTSDSNQPLNRTTPLLKSPGGHSLTLDYQAEDEDRIVREIFAMGGSSRPPLTVSFLLIVCVQCSAARLHATDLRRILLLIASRFQSAIWVSYTFWESRSGPLLKMNR